VQKIQSDTIPYAGSSLWLNAQESAASPWWHRIQEQVKGFEADGKRNIYGFILAGPDGSVYATVDNVHRDIWQSNWNAIFGTGMSRFKTTPPKHVEITPSDLTSKTYGNDFDRTRSVIRVYCRLAGDRGWKRYTNRDPAPGVMHFSIFKNEVEQLLALKPNADSTVLLPPVILARLVAVHLSDNQTGSGLSWAADEIKKCEFTARLTREDAETRTFAFEGLFAMQTNDEIRFSVSGNLTGEFTVNRRSTRIERFRAYFDGMESGCLRRYETRKPQRVESMDMNATRGPSPLRIAFIEATDEMAYNAALGHRPPVLNYMCPEMTAEWQKRYGSLTRNGPGPPPR
jgi:hypothetical protein